MEKELNNLKKEFSLFQMAYMKDKAIEKSINESIILDLKTRINTLEEARKVQIGINTRLLNGVGTPTDKDLKESLLDRVKGYFK